MSKTALKALKDEVARLQAQQADCISDNGFVLTFKRYKYQELMRTIKDLKRSIDTLERFTSDKIVYR